MERIVPAVEGDVQGAGHAGGRQGRIQVFGLPMQHFVGAGLDQGGGQAAQVGAQGRGEGLRSGRCR